MFREYNFFWTTMELCDWDQEGDDDKVLKPVIEYLSKQEDYIIFEFDDLMSELLYHLDTEKLAEQCKKVDPLMSDDSFLYSRCVALINGPDYYKKVKQGNKKSVWDIHQAGFRIFQILRTAQDRDNQIDAVAGCDQTFLDLLLLLFLFQKYLILAGIIFILEIQVIL